MNLLFRISNYVRFARYFELCEIWSLLVIHLVLVFGFLISDSVSFFLPILIQWCLLVCEDCKGRKGRKEISFKFQLYFVWVFIRLLCSEKCLSGFVSPKQGIEIHQSSPVVNKSKFSEVMSRGVFMLPTSACRLASSRQSPCAMPSGIWWTGVLPY